MRTGLDARMSNYFRYILICIQLRRGRKGFLSGLIIVTRSQDITPIQIIPSIIVYECNALNKCTI